MCGRFNLTQSPLVHELMELLGVSASQLRFNADCAPCMPISIVTHHEGGHHINDALWHLYLQPHGNGFKPHPRYWSINTNWQQLAKKIEFRNARCLIPATAFVESQDGKNPHLLDFEQQPFCFGGLYKTWQNPVSGEQVFSASIITLAGHPKLEAIHRKSLPLIFNHSAVADMHAWLDNATSPTQLEAYLQPSLKHNLQLVAVDKSSSKKPIQAPFIIEADGTDNSSV